jgi:hypothetical protein
MMRKPSEGSVIYIQSPARPKPPYFGGVSQTDDGPGGIGQHTVTVHRHHDGYHASWVSYPPLLQNMDSSRAFRLTLGQLCSIDTPSDPCLSGTGAGLLPIRPL